jgi:signal transduction histidine kinase
LKRTVLLTSDRPAARLRFIAAIASITAIAIPLGALVGWVAGNDALRQVVPGAKAMNPLSVIALLLCSVALWLARDGSPSRTAIRRVVSSVVIGIGMLRLIGPVSERIFAVDLLLFRDQILQMVPPARMAHSTAICLVALGAGLLLYDPESRRHRIARLLVIPVLTFAMLAATGYLYSAQGFFDLPALHPMSLPTSVTLLALGIGLATLPPILSPMNRLVEDGTGGAMARRLLPAAFLVPFVLGYIRVAGERAGWFDLGFGTAAFVMLTAVALAALVLLSIRQVGQTEAAQAKLAAAVRDSEQRTLRLLDGLPTGVFVVDSAGRPSYANAKSGEILGRGTLPDARPEDISERYGVYRTGSDIAYPPDQIPVVRAIRGDEVYASDLEIHRPDRVVPVEVWARPIRNETGEIEFAVAAFNDISERLENQRKIDQLNAELAHQVAELAAVNKELETFSYSVSHDLRAPLRAIDGFSQVLETDHAAVLDPEAIRYLSRIRSNVRRMGLLIDDLLKFSRLSRKELDTQAVDMASLVRNVLDDLARSRQHPQIRMNELPTAQGDIDLLRQVWINLIDNAIKYSGKRPKPRIEISGHQAGDETRYTVRDNGVGFDMAYADKLFGVFQRLHRQDEFEGTGVGLAIVQRVIHRHGGRIWAEAAPDGGAAFHFTLPAGGQNGGS